MGLLQRLELRQGQALVMTPQLLQAIKLLQLSHLELLAHVEAELERNPLLERVETDVAEDAQPDRPDGPESDVDGGDAGEEGDSDEFAPDWLASDLGTSRAEMESSLDTTLDNVF